MKLVLKNIYITYNYNMKPLILILVKNVLNFNLKAHQRKETPKLAPKGKIQSIITNIKLGFPPKKINKQDRRYRTRVEKFIYVYRSKIML